MFRTIPNALVLYPSDAVSAERAVEIAANFRGIVYIKGGRANHPILYDNDETFEAGKAKVLKQSQSDKITIVSGGATIFEVLKAHEKFAKEGVNVRVIDIFSVKPIDKDVLIKAAKETNGLVYVVEDHYPEGGIGGNKYFNI
jgi:transketolase